MDQMQGQMPNAGVELGGQSATAGYTICINVGGDGTISVATEPMEAEMGDGEAMGSPAKDIQEALAMAIDIFKNGGQMPPDTASADMAAGFNKVKQVGM